MHFMSFESFLGVRLGLKYVDTTMKTTKYYGGSFCNFLGLMDLSSIFLKKTDFSRCVLSGVWSAKIFQRFENSPAIKNLTNFYIDYWHIFLVVDLKSINYIDICSFKRNMETQWRKIYCLRHMAIDTFF